MLTPSGSYGKRKDHSRSRTTPVNREDIQAGLSSTSTPPQVFARRRSEPPPTGTLSLHGYYIWDNRLKKKVICERIVLTGYTSFV